MSYFLDSGERQYAATEHTGGAWNPQEQHVAPAFGLLVHAVEQHGGGGDARPVRLSFDVLGTIPIGAVEVGVETVRGGRSVSLVEATLSAEGRAAVRLRAWFMVPFATEEIAHTGFNPLPRPEAIPAWQSSEDWPGGFIASLEGRRQLVRPGRAQAWIRSPHALVDNEQVSGLATFCALLDTANGVAPLVSPREAFFPNLDLTVSFVRIPHPGWVGFDTTVSCGATGYGLTHSVVHDESGPVGVMTQSLTVRPRV